LRRLALSSVEDCDHNQHGHLPVLEFGLSPRPRPWALALGRLTKRDGHPYQRFQARAVRGTSRHRSVLLTRSCCVRNINITAGGPCASDQQLPDSLKYILDDLSQKYEDAADLPNLYGLTTKALKLAPSQHTEEVFKQVLGGCTSVVNGLAAMRNRLSDSHGKSKAGVKPAPRHAELAVNLSGAMATYLIATWQARKASKT
jgi:hypothetical protein